MPNVQFTSEEQGELLQILERYLPDLEMEIADTERKEFRQELERRRKMMVALIGRLKATPS